MKCHHLQLYTVYRKYYPQQRFSKTALVKLLYFAQEVEGAELGYSFDLETFGPFTQTILNELYGMECEGTATVKYVNDHYVIDYYDKPDSILSEIEQAVKKFGYLCDFDMETLASIHFLRDVKPTRESMYIALHGIKPRVDRTTFDKMYRLAVQFGLIPDSTSPASIDYKKRKEAKLLEDDLDWRTEEEKIQDYEEAYIQVHNRKRI